MKQTIFETKQRAEELLREAINIWRQSDDNERLEGLESDPVMKLLITALAYQANESASDLEALKTEVLEEFAQLLTPYETGHATPATAVVETALQDSVTELEMTDQSVFTLNGTNFSFMPLLRTRLLNAKVNSIIRMDGRRFKVTIRFNSPVKDLSGFAFAVDSLDFQDLTVRQGDRMLPLIRPWDYSELPLQNCFGLDTILYNRSQTYEASATCLDLFARQNVRLFVIGRQGDRETGRQGGWEAGRLGNGGMLPTETDGVDLIFEFTGISDRFVFDKQHFSLNPIVLVNAQIHQTTLSGGTPIVRVAGYDKDEDHVNLQFLHAVRPSEEQLYGNSLVEVRRVAADRFNQGRLVRLLNSLIARYHSDFYAFQGLQGFSGDKTMQALQETLMRLMEITKKDQLRQVPGVYLLLRNRRLIESGKGSLDVSYLTTAGAGVNGSLHADSTFTVPGGLSGAQTRQIANPVMGRDETTEEAALASLSRYYIATNDRIVTPADIKLFCYNELLTRYGIVRDMVKSLTVNRRQQMDRHGCGYEIVVEIVLADNPFVRRSFAEKASRVEILMQKMIEVRSTNIYPVVVTLRIGPRIDTE
jgi:hypothetical protein